jgi:hypothetical protein
VENLECRDFATVHVSRTFQEGRSDVKAVYALTQNGDRPKRESAAVYVIAVGATLRHALIVGDLKRLVVCVVNNAT